MKIAICFKTVADHDLMDDKDWVADRHLRVDTDRIRQTFNCYDESGLEMALKLSDQAAAQATSLTLTALTIDDQRADLFLKHLHATGFNHCLRIGCDPVTDLRFNPLGLSRIIAAAVTHKVQQDLLILGTRGGDGENGQTGPLVAERLGWPCIRDVTQVNLVDRSSLQVVSRSTHRRLKQTVRLPVVLVIGNSLTSPYLRVPTLIDKLAAKRKAIRVIPIADLGLDPVSIAGQGLRLNGLSPRPSGRSCTWVNGATVRDQAERFYARYLKAEIGP